MPPVRTSQLKIPALLVAAAAAIAPASAQEIYRWVDANGVVNFSDKAPPAAAADTVVVDDTRPSNYDPEEDIYNVAAQAERMQALREEMEQERAARRERQQSAPQQPAVQYEQGVRYGYPYLYPGYGRPPHRPPGKPPGGGRPPRPEPYETTTLRPPGQARNPNGP
jgi:hypothetical protein